MRKPRRVRRRLLLPPGWVALGFLLLLGCLTLVPRWRQLRLNNVIQLTIPQWQADKVNMWPAIFYQSPKELEKYRPWHTINLGDEVVADFFGTAITEAAIRRIIADTSHAGGVRVRFWPGTTYASLISVLDIMHRTNQKKYWLDIHHQPTTLYAITDKYSKSNKPVAVNLIGCLLCDDVIREQQTTTTYTSQKLLIELLQKVKSLKDPLWRQPVFLLFVMSSLSLWRLLPKKQV